MTSSADDMQSFYKSNGLNGRTRVPGDKSITHRGILFGLLADGTTTIDGWLDAADCRSSLSVAQALGAKVNVTTERVTIEGTCGNLQEPTNVLDCGNSGTTIRIFSGIFASLVPFACVTGDDSLRKRPMDRVIEPLRLMGAHFEARNERFAPFSVSRRALTGIEYTLPMPSAQVKSAILIAGCFAQDKPTTVHEPIPSRDHTENMLAAFGVKIERTSFQDSGVSSTVSPNQQLKSTHVHVPGDVSSAAFFACAAAIVPNSNIIIEDIGLNPYRIGVLQVLRRMGVNVSIEGEHTIAGEKLGNIRVTTSNLIGTQIEEAEVPSLIDEIPILAIVAAAASGDTVIRGARELRFKETDRITAIAKGLRAIGGDVEELEDGLVIHGHGTLKGGTVNSYGDHRIAMSFAIAGLIAKQGVHIQNWSCVQISFPSFLDTLQKLI